VSLDALKIDAIEKHDQIGRLDRNADHLRLVGGGELEGFAL
jgi:hypothetical protein